MSKKELEESVIDMKNKQDQFTTIEKKMGKWTLRKTFEIVFGSAAAAHLYHQQNVINQIDSVKVGVSKCLDVMDKFELHSKEAVQAQIVMGNLLKNLPNAKKELNVWRAKFLLIEKEAKADAKIRKEELDKEYKENCKLAELAPVTDEEIKEDKIADADSQS